MNDKPKLKQKSKKRINKLFDKFLTKHKPSKGINKSWQRYGKEFLVSYKIKEDI